MFLDQFKDEIFKLCAQHKVKEFYVFGSVMTNSFGPDSDLDFIVSFLPDIPVEEYSSHYFPFLFELEKLTGRSIDLMTKKEIRNPFLKKSIEETQTLFYAA